jgi:hypothetical protein
MPATDKLLGYVQSIFYNFKITLSAKLFNIDLTYTGSTVDAVDQIFEALRSLAKIAKEQQKKVIFFIDEFQDIAALESSKAIQGAIRHVAQATSDITFIFSGSNRHLLLELFDDKALPLYMLCDKLYLDRMSSNTYEQHIQQLALDKWGQNISTYVFTQIMKLTEMHPFYVNMLANHLWCQNLPPRDEDVAIAWEHCYVNEKRRLIAEIEQLSNNQQDILKALALTPIIEPTGQKFLAVTGKAYSSIRQALKVLTEKDMIYTVTKEDIAVPGLKCGQLRVLDPLLAYALRKYS